MLSNMSTSSSVRISGRAGVSALPSVRKPNVSLKKIGAGCGQVDRSSREFRDRPPSSPGMKRPSNVTTAMPMTMPPPRAGRRGSR
jgi:hypothetical protein